MGWGRTQGFDFACCFFQKFSVAEAVAELREIDGVSNFEGDGVYKHLLHRPPTETSVSFTHDSMKVLPAEFWEALRCLVDLQELKIHNEYDLEALPEGHT